jgi:hypothetical protein
MDVTNPGTVSVEAETYGNPDPNGGQAKWRPRDVGDLDAVSDEGYPAPEGAGVESSVFPTPANVLVTGVVPLLPVLASVVPPAAEVEVSDQCLGQGTMVPVDPANPAAGSLFQGPAEFTVVDAALSVQTNPSEQTTILCEVAAVRDADTFGAPGPNTTRYLLVVATPPLLTSYPVSLLGRQIVFADDTLTAADQGAARFITGYASNYVVVNRDDNTVDDGTVPTLTAPQVGDTFWVDVQRQGSEDVSSTSFPEIDVYIDPPPPPFVASPAQDQGLEIDVNATTGPQPGDPYVGSGTQLPPLAVATVEVADQSPVRGLPTEVFA